jgi:hypothetical protein
LDILKKLLSGLENPFDSPILDINEHFPKIPFKQYPPVTKGRIDMRNSQPVTPPLEPKFPLGTPVKK